MRHLDFIKNNTKNLIIILFLFLMLFLLIRNNGLYPMVFADEFTYSKFSRLVPLSESTLPNYLYFLIYRLTNECGDGFLGCARILNVLFFALTMPFIYLVSRQVCGKFISLTFVLFVAIGQTNSYTAYFMPECLYALSFWMGTAATLQSDRHTSHKKWILIGFTWGVSSLVKPHTVFIIPALAIYVLYISEAMDRSRIRTAFLNATALVIGAIGIKLFVGYCVAGSSGLSLFGTFYSPYAGAALHKGIDYYLHLANLSMKSLFGHTLALALFYATPVAILIDFWINAAKNRRLRNCNFSRLAVFSTLIIASLLAVTSLFTASISNDEPLYHLHVRYYVFALPLIMMLPIHQIGNIKKENFSILRLAIAFVVACLLLYGTLVKLHPYEVHSSTAPEVWSLLTSGNLFYLVEVVSLVSLILWTYSRGLGAAIYIFCLAPVLAVIVFVNMNSELRRSIEPDVYDRAAAFANAYLDKADRQQVVIVGPASGVGGYFRTLYHLDLPVTEYGIQTVDGASDYNLANLPKGKNWILLIGDNRLVGTTILTIPGNGFSLTRAR